MRRIVWSRAATRDLARIRAFIAISNPFAAARMVEALEAAADGLINFPERGQTIRGALRRLTTIRPYVIVYRVRDDAIDIMHVRHAARRPI